MLIRTLNEVSNAAVRSAYLQLRRTPACCMAAAGIGFAAWTQQETLLPLAVLVFLPALIFQAGSRFGAFLVAAAYYGTATRAVPGIISGFFPGLPAGAELLLWAVHAALLGLPWLILFPRNGAAPLQRAWRAAAALLLAAVPPLGLFHWGSPLMAAGLLYPGWQWCGLAACGALLALLAASSWRAMRIHFAIGALLLLALVANVNFDVAPPPAGWRAVSLELGKSPGLWSDEMAERRQMLADTALRHLEQGDEVLIFPESISGSNRRPQADIWSAVARKTDARGATVLVGEEHWNKARSSFKNALVGYGRGEVVVSSRVPMPVGDWKFGYEEGAETEIFASDVITLHGKQVAFSMCYEDFLLWTHRGLLRGKAELLVSVSNQWPSSGTSAETAQDISRLALARLAGVPLLIAKNH
jgi:hypothetical protein